MFNEYYSYNFYIKKLNSSTGTLIWNTLARTGQDLFIPADLSKIAVDNLGNIYTAGYETITTSYLPGAKISKINGSTGSITWEKTIPVGSQGFFLTGKGTAIAVDSSNAPYFAGYTSIALNGTGGLIGTQDAFFSKLDKDNGDILLIKQIGVSSKITSAEAITIDSSSNIYLGGTTNGNLPGKTLKGYQDAFLIKYDSSGVLLNTFTVGKTGSKSTIGLSAIVDSDGNAYLSGTTNGSIQPGYTINGLYDFFWTKFENP